MKTSQYPLKSLQGDPGCSVITVRLNKCAHLSEAVLLQVLGFAGRKERGSDTFKQSSNFCISQETTGTWVIGAGIKTELLLFFRTFYSQESCFTEYI